MARDPEHRGTFGDGRVRVYGCSPGCLLVSLALTILVNVVIRLF